MKDTGIKADLTTILPRCSGRREGPFRAGPSLSAAGATVRSLDRGRSADSGCFLWQTCGASRVILDVEWHGHRIGEIWRPSLPGAGGPSPSHGHCHGIITGSRD